MVGGKWQSYHSYFNAEVQSELNCVISDWIAAPLLHSLFDPEILCATAVLWAQTTVFYSWSYQYTFCKCSLLHTTKTTFFSLTLRPGIRLGSKYLSYALGSGLSISAVSSWVAMQFLKSVCLTAHSTHTQQLNRNRRPQWEITTFTGTYGPQPLSV